jgi:XTP/dITP diphosphohydrolase
MAPSKDGSITMIPHKIVIASHNRKKIDEMRRILDQSGLEIEIVGTDQFPELADVEETGTTFSANAMLKAHYVSEATGLPAVADDSGLCVDALNGMPGILSARWAGQHGNDQANMELLLSQIAHVPEKRRGAAFVCAIAYCEPGGREFIVEGSMNGSLILSPRGTNGFGYDPIFVPMGRMETTAEMTSSDKDAISHRGHALKAFVKQLLAT